MTRETKIGLLVGLAFVLVFGILISDHLSSTNEPPAAPLRAAGDSLRSGLGQPANDTVAAVLRAPQNIVPQQPVVTVEELNHHTAQPPVHFVTPPPSGQAIIPATVAGNIPDRLRQVAQANGEELVQVNNGATVMNNTPPVDPQPPAPPVVRTTARTYVAQPGDSLGAIAQKAYGSSCRANREAIVAANPTLADNRDLIVAGRTYTIPALATTAVNQTPQPAAEKPAPAANLTYVVKPHDTLWSIAVNEVGSPSAVAAIEELNSEILNGSDRVRPNMKLTLPKRNDE